MTVIKQIEGFGDQVTVKYPKLRRYFQFALFFLKVIYYSIYYVVWAPLRFTLVMVFNITSDPTYLGIFIAPTFTLAYKWIVDHNLFFLLFPYDLMNDIDILRNYIDWVGILYGFLVSTILVRAWDRANNISKALAREAKEIFFLIEIFEKIILNPSSKQAKSKQRILLNIKRYVERFDDVYNSEYKNVDQKLEGDKELLEITFEAIQQFETSKKYNNFGFGQVIQRIMNARNERIENAQHRFPLIIWILLLISSTLWLALFTFMNFANNSIGYAFFFGVSFIVGTIIGIVLIFNEPTKIEQNDLSGSWEKLKVKVSSIS